VPTLFSDVVEGEERFRAPREMTACRIEGEVSQAWSMSLDQRSEERGEERRRDVELQKVVKAACSWGVRNRGVVGVG
jgi:hypothetical protein